MNKTISLVAIAMVAVIMGLGAFAPAMATPNGGDGEKHNPKVAICHFDYNEMVWESDKMVNAHSLLAHQDHDDKIISDHDDDEHITVVTCEGQAPLPPKV